LLMSSVGDDSGGRRNSLNDIHKIVHPMYLII
jgi:hypothetical protein